MHIGLKQAAECCIDQAVTLELRSATERRGHQPDAKVSTRSRTGMARVRRAVVRDLERHGRKVALDGSANQCNPDLRHRWFLKTAPTDARLAPGGERATPLAHR